tara:strand:- start:291 stop:773 length:483 start_codon:yes stop_codon:yes gene_type:complete
MIFFLLIVLFGTTRGITPPILFAEVHNIPDNCSIGARIEIWRGGASNVHVVGSDFRLSAITLVGDSSTSSLRDVNASVVNAKKYKQSASVLNSTFSNTTRLKTFTANCQNACTFDAPVQLGPHVKWNAISDKITSLEQLKTTIDNMTADVNRMTSTVNNL